MKQVESQCPNSFFRFESNLLKFCNCLDLYQMSEVNRVLTPFCQPHLYWDVNSSIVESLLAFLALCSNMAHCMEVTVLPAWSRL